MLPSNFNYIDTLVERYENEVENVTALIAHLDATPNATKDLIFESRYKPYKELNEVLVGLKSSYWVEVYNRSNLNDIISMKARDEIHKSFRDDKENLPPFTVDNIKMTLEGWVTSSHRMFSEKVDTIFQSLSGEHVTNRPHGFSKKMIFKHMVDYTWGSGVFNTYSFSTRATDLIHDLRTAIQCLYGLPMSNRYDTSATLRGINERNEFTGFDNDAFKIKIFKNGNAHVEVHPHVAMMLNSELAKLYPNAIPPKHRVVTKDIKEYTFEYEHFATETKDKLREFIMYSKAIKGVDTIKYSFNHLRSNYIHKHVAEVLEFLQVKTIVEHREYESEYNLTEVIRHMITNGIVEYKSNQYYPTPQIIVDDIIDYVGDIGDRRILEPSAGMGNIAKAFKDNIDCIEKEPLNALILQQLGLNVVQGDFLYFNPKHKYDIIVMNPPYNKNQWKTHTEHAISMLSKKGEIYAVLPSGKLDAFSDVNVTLVNTYENLFEDTSITTCLYKITLR